jgi:protein-disulfide isomerase
MPDYDDEDLSQPADEQPTPTPGEGERQSQSVGRRARARVLAIGAAGAAIAVVVAVVATSGGGSPVKKQASAHTTTTAQEINALLAGIPQSANTLGSPTAPVTMQYFGDLECSTSRAFTLTTLLDIIRRWVRPGDLRIEYRSLRTVSEPEVFSTQQVAALAAGMQNKLWYYLENFYHEQGREHSGYVTEDYLQALARQVPHLNLEQWAEDRHDPLLAGQVTEDEQAAIAAHFNSTPSLLVGRTGSTPQHSFNQFSALDLAAVNEAVQQVIHSQPDRVHRVPPGVAFSSNRHLVRLQHKTNHL